MRKLWYILPVLVVLGIVLFGIQPYLQVNAPVEQGVLIVEGWIPGSQLPMVEQQFRSGYYNKIVTTGTTRPFAYYLKNGERLRIKGIPCSGLSTFQTELTGIPGAHVAVVSGLDTLLNEAVDGTVSTHSFNAIDVIDSLMIHCYCTAPCDKVTDVVFIKSLLRSCDGSAPENMHVVTSAVDRTKFSGEVVAAARNYGQSAKAGLMDLGVQGSDIIALEPLNCPFGGNTLCNAETFAHHAKQYDLSKGDLISFGVHGRRSFKNYQRKLEGFHLGVISLTDTACTRTNWWKTAIGRRKVFKEISGLLFGASVEVKEQLDE
jgi:hypothetical protein